MKHTIVKASDLGDDWTAEHHIAAAEKAAAEKACVTCGGPANTVGWSQCDDCYWADQFNGWDYWLRPLSAVLFVIALCFIIAAIAKLGGQ